MTELLRNANSISAVEAGRRRLFNQSSSLVASLLAGQWMMMVVFMFTILYFIRLKNAGMMTK